MAAHDMVCGGVRRRIGNGKTTQIWDHPWLQDKQDPMIHTDKPPYLNNATVMGLIDHETQTWDPDILTDIFIPTDVARIRKIPISPEYEDMWYWHGDQGGNYTVKSGYKAVVGDLNDNMDTNQIIHAAAILYYIWKARNGAVWEACLPRPQKILASARSTVLAWQHIHPNQAPHRAVAQQHATATAVLQQQQRNTATAVLHQQQHDTQQQHGVTAAVLQQQEHSSIAAAVLQQQEYETAADYGIIAQDGISQPIQYTPVRKCYFDAGFSPITGKATVGAILISEEGEYISAFSAPLSDCFSPLMAEALACKEALSWLWNRGERSIRLFTDCLTLKQYLSNANVLLRTYVGYAVDACRARITSFNYCPVIFIPRSENYLAHSLAASAFIYSTVMYSDDVPPNSISEYFE
ncbi:PREDICTED: uncharacterized protein LOC109171736 [Ipomoea nil]|uniref:uncharacterized protein LOC109171736 n=1 Tax=Ipomoea nil TaxID=35883 RepID=UPI00090187F4|nr:PREDICTED: uncharacterized protein LOC109171736 [Ipomoea nil]